MIERRTTGLQRLLLTGFGPFPGCPDNPTPALAARVAAMLAARAGRAGWAIVTATIDVTWDAPARLIGRLAAERPAFAGVIALGVARGRGRIEVERFAHNRATPAARDARGALAAAGLLVEGAAPSLEGHLHRAPYGPVTEAAAARGLPLGFSDDAGGYLCNALFYRLLEAAARDGPLAGATGPVGFIHVPPLAGLGRVERAGADADEDRLLLPPLLPAEQAVETLAAVIGGWLEACSVRA